jgi:hypothetical protein
MYRSGVNLVILVLLVLADVVPARQREPAQPLYVEVYVRAATANGRDERVAGDLVRYDGDTLTVKTSRAERELKWINLTPGSAFVVRSRLIDKSDARQWLELGRFGWSVNAKEQARSALATAVKLDATLKEESQRILSAAPGSALVKPDRPSPPTTTPTALVDEKGSSNLMPAEAGKRLGRDRIVKYEKSTPERDAAAIEVARNIAKEVSGQLKVSFTEIQTDHFILFTDWDKREHGFLKDNLEGAYAVVSQQFEIPVKENVFVGKLPVFMFSKGEDFRKFAREVDGFAASTGVSGYYASLGTTGVGHMAMWKPDVQRAGGNVRQAEIEWAYVLTHEFTHAFLARYRSNEHVPRWLNEGVAELIANGKFPRPTARSWARTMASRQVDFSPLFNDDVMPSGEMYPVMMTLVETLVVRDRKAFLGLFDDIKAGDDPLEALKKRYGLDYAGLVKAWKAHVMSR